MEFNITHAMYHLKQALHNISLDYSIFTSAKAVVFIACYVSMCVRCEKNYDELFLEVDCSQGPNWVEFGGNLDSFMDPAFWSVSHQQAVYQILVESTLDVLSIHQKIQFWLTKSVSSLPESGWEARNLSKSCSFNYHNFYKEPRITHSNPWQKCVVTRW